MKTILMIFVFSVVVVEVAMTYYAVVISNRNNERYINVSNGLSATVAKVVEENEFLTVKEKVKSIMDGLKANPDDLVFSNQGEDEAYTFWQNNFEHLLTDDAEFKTAFDNIREDLQDVANANKANYVDCAYIAYVDYFMRGEQKVGMFIYLVDSAPEDDMCPPGWVDPIYNVNKKVLDEPKRGFPAYTTNTNYGYLMTSGTAIYQHGDAENPIGYGFVDLNLTFARNRQANGIIRLFAYLSITVVLIAAIGVVVVYFIFTKPIRQLNKAAKSFDPNDPEKTHESFVNLKIKTHDEIKELSESIQTMESAVYDRMNKLTTAYEELVTAQKTASKMAALANKDSLTGVQSKTAYDTEVDCVNELIEQGEKLIFGVAMIDLNYLKNTNDEYGHDAGDEALIKLANIICLTFAHSPVYRIGGDEFVVLLRDGDYKKSKELIAEFNERIADSINNIKLPNYERVSAAIGYSEFDSKKDKTVDDVFRRADKAMYQRKHQMKEE